MEKPTIHLTNFASRKLHSGRVFTIMARPRQWEHGEGIVDVLTPLPADLIAYQAGVISLFRYRVLFERHLDKVDLSPGVLSTGGDTLVVDGDTLCCACSKAEALAERCHRAWAAPYLVRAGWRVVLDGVVL